MNKNRVLKRSVLIVDGLSPKITQHLYYNFVLNQFPDPMCEHIAS